MDFLKKAATDYMNDQMGGNKNNNQSQGQNYNDNNQGQGQNQNQQQNYPNQSGYGGSGGNDYNSNNQQQQSFGGNQGGNQGGYGNNQGGNDFGVTGGPQYNAPHGSGGAGNQGSGGIPNIDEGSAIQAANAHSGNGNENASMFSSAFSMIQGMGKNDADDLDEDDIQKKHDEVYNRGQAGNMSANGIGAAAALQAFKQFTSGSGGAAQNSGGGNMQSKIIGMAMSEAAKMFDQSGGAAQGNKQDAVSGAAGTVMKLLLKSQMSGTMGGGNSGGLGQLMSMASKFM